jgi:hypothetical protein
MPSNPLENDMLLMNEAFREAMGDISQAAQDADLVDVVVDGDSILRGKYAVVKSSGGPVKETTVSLFVKDPQSAKSALFLTDTYCDLISLGDDVELQGGTIESVTVDQTGSRYLVTIEVANYSEES